MNQCIETWVCGRSHAPDEAVRNQSRVMREDSGENDKGSSQFGDALEIPEGLYRTSPLFLAKFLRFSDIRLEA